MSAFRTAIAAARATVQAVAGVAVTYTRGASVVALTATPGRTQFELDNGDGVILNIESRDYLIDPADLVIAGTASAPASGDRITEGDRVYEVMPFGREPAWRWSDTHRTRYRVHTKQIDS